MANVRAFYGPPNQSHTTVDLDRSEPLDYINALLKREDTALKRRATAAPVAAAPIRRPAPLVLSQAGPSERTDPRLDALIRRDKILQLQAKSQAPQRRFKSGFNWGGYFGPDPEELNAYQRELYLPSSSGQVGGFGPGARASELGPTAGRIDAPDVESPGGDGFENLSPLDRARYIQALVRSNGARG